MPSPHGVGVVTGMRAATIALASLRTCVAIAEASPDVGTETSGLHLDSCPCPLELHVAARDIRSRGPFLECERGRLQHAELVGAGANHLARLAGDRRIGSERRRGTQRKDPCGDGRQASTLSPHARPADIRHRGRRQGLTSRVGEIAYLLHLASETGHDVLITPRAPSRGENSLDLTSSSGIRLALLEEGLTYG